MERAQKINLIDDLINESADSTIREYLDTVAEIEQIECGETEREALVEIEHS